MFLKNILMCFLFAFPFSNENSDLTKVNFSLNKESQLFIINLKQSKSFFKRITGKEYPVTYEKLEKKALEGSNEACLKIARGWFSLLDDVFSYDHAMMDEKNRVQATEYAINWLFLGAKREDGLCCYTLFLTYRLLEGDDSELVQHWANTAFHILSHSSQNYEELLALYNCYLNGWGTIQNTDKAREIYILYKQKCLESGVQPIQEFSLKTSMNN